MPMLEQIWGRKPTNGSGYDQGDDQVKVTWMQWYRIKYSRSKPREALEILNAAMSLLSVCTYVYDTYIHIPTVNRIVYFVCSWTFSVEYFAKLLAAREPLRYLLWDWSLIDVATIVYGFVYFFGNLSSSGLGFVRLLRIIQVARLIKVASSAVLRYSRHNIQPMQLEYVRRSLELALTLTGVTFIAGCVFYELEVSSQDLQLHQALYWSCVTIATIGYGDYSPTTVAGQLLFPLIILIIILVLPRKISDLSEVMQTFSRFMRRSHVSAAFGLHVVLTGHVTPLSAQTFIGEFFHPDRGYQELDLLLLRPHDPEPQLVISMNNTQWERRVKYLNGSPFRAEDLARADTARSLAVFVMSNKYAPDPGAEDTRTLLAVLAIAQFLRQFGGPDGAAPPRVMGWSSTCWRAKDRLFRHARHPHIVAQFLLNGALENAVALLASGARHPPELGLMPLEVSPFPICVGHLRASLLGASVHTPGLITLVSNLCISCNLTRRTLLGKQDISLLDDCGWLSDYLRGAATEIYDVTFPKDYWGLSFKQAALRLWREEEVILLGLRFPNHQDERQRFDVKLAPLAERGRSGTSGGGGAGLSCGRLIDGQTIGFILHDDALVLGAAAWGVKNALDAHDDPDAMNAKETYPVDRMAPGQASDTSRRLRRTSSGASPTRTRGGSAPGQPASGAPPPASSPCTAGAAAAVATPPPHPPSPFATSAQLLPAASTARQHATAAAAAATSTAARESSGPVQAAAQSGGTLSSNTCTARSAGREAQSHSHPSQETGAAAEVGPLGPRPDPPTPASGSATGAAAAPGAASPGPVSEPVCVAPAAAAASLPATEEAPPPASADGSAAGASPGPRDTPADSASKTGCDGGSVQGSSHSLSHDVRSPWRDAGAVHGGIAVASCPPAHHRPDLVAVSLQHDLSPPGRTAPAQDSPASGAVVATAGGNPRRSGGSLWAVLSHAAVSSPPTHDHQQTSQQQHQHQRAGSFGTPGPHAAATAASPHTADPHTAPADTPRCEATGSPGPDLAAASGSGPTLSRRSAAAAAAAAAAFRSTLVRVTAAARPTARSVRQQGYKASIKSRDMNTLAAISTRQIRRPASGGSGGNGRAAAGAGRDAVRRLALRSARSGGLGSSAGGESWGQARSGQLHQAEEEASARPAPPAVLRPQTVTSLADQEPLDSPVIIAGSSCFSQLPQIVAAIRAAPPVGTARRFRNCPIVIMDDSKTSPHNPYKALLGESLLSTIGRVPGALPGRIFVLRGSAQDSGDVEKLNLMPGRRVHALLVPSTELYTEEAVVGSEPALADGQVMLAADALRRYCEELDCSLSVVSEVLALLNTSYALPLCLPEGPYRDSHQLRPQQQPSMRRMASMQWDRLLNSASMQLRLAGWRGRRGVRQSEQEAYVQYILSAMPHLAPALAPGHILMQTFMDALLCQTVFNPMMLQILLKMLHCWDEQDDQEPGAGEGESVGQTHLQRAQQASERDVAFQAAHAYAGSRGTELPSPHPLPLYSASAAPFAGAASPMPGSQPHTHDSRPSAPGVRDTDVDALAGAASDQVLLPLLPSTPPPEAPGTAQQPLHTPSSSGAWQPTPSRLRGAPALSSSPAGEPGAAPEASPRASLADAGVLTHGSLGLALQPINSAPALLPPPLESMAALPSLAALQSRATVATERGGSADPAGASATVRIFCFNFATMLREMTGLRPLLCRAQRQQQALQCPLGAAPATAGVGVRTDAPVAWRPGLLDVAAGAGFNAAPDGEGGCGVGGGEDHDDAWCGEEAVGLRLLGDGGVGVGESGHGRGSAAAARAVQSLDVCFGVLYDVLVEKYDMLPVGLYRRDAGNGASGCRGASGGGCGGGPSHGAATPSGDGADVSARRPHGSGTGSGLPYVYTKPCGASTWLRSSDDVYVLTSPAVVLKYMGPSA